MPFGFDDLLERFNGDTVDEAHSLQDSRFSGNISVMTSSEVASMFPGVTLSDSNHIAYLPVTMCNSLPTVNKRGRCFSEKTIRNSAATATDSLVNIEHRTKDHGSARDHITGHIKAIAVGERTQDGIPLNALLALYKRNEDAAAVIKDTLTKSGRPWRTSMECRFLLSSSAFLYEGETIPLKSAPSEMLECVEAASVRNYRGKKLALMCGGDDGVVDYWGIGLTETPADSKSRILGIVSREIASQGRKFYPVKFCTTEAPSKPDEEAVIYNTEVASEKATESAIAEIASIEVIGETMPAEDGHYHDILTDGTILSANGHTHSIRSYHLQKGTNPTFTGTTTGHYECCVNAPDGTEIRPSSEHIHVFEISLRGKKSKGSSTKDESSAEASVDSAQDTASLFDFLTGPREMPKKITEIVTDLRKLLETKRAALGDSSEVASILTDLGRWTVETEVSDRASAVFETEVASGNYVKKADHLAAVKAAEEAAEKKVRDEFEIEKKKSEKIQSRIAAVTAIGVNPESKEDGKDRTVRELISSIPLDDAGDGWFASELERLKAVVQIKTLAQSAADKKTESAPATTVASAPAQFLIGGTSTETKPAQTGITAKRTFFTRSAS